MQKLEHLIRLLAFTAIIAFCPSPARAQTRADVYNSIKARPSTIRWCLPEAGDDPAHIIGDRCKVYRDCLTDSGLDEKVDQTPFPSLAAEKIDSVRKCHQALFNAAKMNPQIKGSGATQQWLQHLVFPDTEAKSFPARSVTGDPR